MSQDSFPHTLTLNERTRLTMTGVTEVISFDDTSVVLKTTLGTLLIQGQTLQLKTLSVDGGQVEVDGTISALNYEEPRSERSWLGRIFG